MSSRQKDLSRMTVPAERRISSRRQAALILPIIACGLLLLSAPGFPQEASWAERIRALIDKNQLDQARNLVDEWIKAFPEDLDARGWHARMQAWTNHWSEAESEYRALLARTPNDVDLMAGLADLFTWQKRHKEALTLLENACSLAPERNDCRLRLARLQQQMGLTREAAASYRAALARDKGCRDAKAGLAQLREDGRHELRIGFEAGLLNYAQDAGTLTTSLRSRWNARWSSYAAVSQFRRFGENATRLDADATLRFGAKNAVTMGGAAARDRGVIPRAEARFTYDRGFDVSVDGPIRGVEAFYQQRWVWYRSARLLALSPGAILYLPAGWEWLVQFSETRSALSAGEIDWKEGGWTRLAFPVAGRVTGHVLFGIGTESLGLVDQVREFRARTWGGGLRIRVNAGQELLGYALYQSLSRGQAETGIGMSYAYRF